MKSATGVEVYLVKGKQQRCPSCFAPDYIEIVVVGQKLTHARNADDNYYKRCAFCDNINGAGLRESAPKKEEEEQ